MTNSSNANGNGKAQQPSFSFGNGDLISECNDGGFLQKESPAPVESSRSSIDEIVSNNIRRLQYLASELQSANTFKRAAAELGKWCKDQRAYMRETEDMLFECIRIIRRLSPAKGYHLLFGWYVMKIVYSYSGLFTAPGHADQIKSWFKELSKLVLLYRETMKPCPSSVHPSCTEETCSSLLSPIQGSNGFNMDDLDTGIAKSVYPAPSPIDPEGMDMQQLTIECPTDERLSEIQCEHNVHQYEVDFTVDERMFSLIESNQVSLRLFAYWKSDVMPSMPSVEWPCEVNVIVNGQTVALEMKHLVYVTVQQKIVAYGADTPCYLNDLCSVGMNKISISLSKCACNAVLAVQAFAPIPFATVMEQVNNKPYFETAPPSATPYLLTLLCPLTQQRISIPVKGKNCQHKECFDLIGYLNYNRLAYQWLCPVCNEKCVVDDIHPDTLMSRILSQAPEEQTSVHLFQDGSIECSMIKRRDPVSHTPLKKLRIETNQADNSFVKDTPSTAHAISQLLTPNTENALDQTLQVQENEDDSLKYLA